jgi:hypothetical protein
MSETLAHGFRRQRESVDKTFLPGSLKMSPGRIGLFSLWNDLESIHIIRGQKRKSSLDGKRSPFLVAAIVGTVAEIRIATRQMQQIRVRFIIMMTRRTSTNSCTTKVFSASTQGTRM